MLSTAFHKLQQGVCFVMKGLVSLSSRTKDLMILILPFNIDAQDPVKEIFKETF